MAFEPKTMEKRFGFVDRKILVEYDKININNRMAWRAK